MRTLLFDIDGTLLITDQAGSGALSESMRREFGLEDFSAEGIQFGGRTDRDLVREVLTVGGIEATPENQGRLRRRYGITLRRTLKTVRGSVLPGVVELLRNLSPLDHVDLAVMTGNFPETARMKLETFSLMEFFPLVVGGDLDSLRCDMARRASEQIGRRGASDSSADVIVIGDTSHDVKCAHSIGAKCLAVCTGSHDRETLQSSGADHIVETLADDGVLEYLTG